MAFINLQSTVSTTTSVVALNREMYDFGINPNSLMPFAGCMTKEENHYQNFGGSLL
jgi:hypothetical protein